MNDEKNIDGKTFFSCKVAAERLGKTPAYIAKQCREGKLEGKKVDGTWTVALPVAPIRTVIKKPTTKKVATQKATPQTLSPITHVVRRIVAALPASPTTTVPVAYARSLPMVVGVVMVLTLFFVASLPFMSQPLASFTNFSEPFVELGVRGEALQSRIARKTNELADYSTLSAQVGANALADQLVNKLASGASMIKIHPRPEGAYARPSALARTLSQSTRIPVDVALLNNIQLAGTAALSLYQFETKDAQYSFTSTEDLSWGCIFGFDSCAQKSLPVPLRGVTVYDIKTKQVHCLQVSSGVATSTPGYCDIEYRE